MLKDKKQQLNLNYLDIANKAICSGEFDMPTISCNTTIYPDFLALDSEPGLFFKTPLTGVCFFRYDDKINGLNGLYNAIYYKDAERLHYYEEKFRGVKFIIDIDPSECGDIHRIENLYRIFQRRIVSIWFTVTLGAIVIPLISYSNESFFEDMLQGIQENCSVVAFSTKGSVKKNSERRLLEKAIVYAVDHLSLKTIVVYSACGDDQRIKDIFNYPISKGIQIVIPQNTLRERNQLSLGDKHGEI